ncbi:MAG: MFS transporter [Synergistaceae bacterium]|nr:MFS transporter [Synergistaceae bacterium]
MDEKILFPVYRYVIGVLICLSTALGVVLIVVPAPLMVTMMEELNIGLALGGMTVSIVTLASGISMFTATFIVEKLGIKKTMIIAMLSHVIGTAVSYLAPNITILLVGRVFSGIGFGVGGSTVSSIITSWFPAKEKPIIITINTLAGSVITAAFYAIAIPLLTMVGTWKNIFGIFVFISMIMVLAWTFLGRDNKAFNDYMKAKQSEKDGETNAKVKQQSGFSMAVKSKEVWIIVLYFSLFTIAANAIQTYLPTYFQLRRGMDAAVAASLTGVISLAGSIGNISGGVATTALGRRKLVIVPAAIVAVLCASGIIMFEQVALLSVLIAIWGFCNPFRSSASQTAIMEVKGVTPAMAAGGYSMMFGFGNVFGFFSPTILEAATSSWGLQNAMLLFVGVAVIATILSFFIKDNGPKGKQKLLSK